MIRVPRTTAASSTYRGRGIILKAMKRQFGFRTFTLDIITLAERSPMTAALNELARQVDFSLRVGHSGRDLPKLQQDMSKLAATPVVAATDPWSEVEYQSLYIRGNNPNDRVVLHQPTVRDPMVGVMVLKAARLSGESGMVFCGKPEGLKKFGSKLGEYEKLGVDLDEEEFLECLMEAAESDGLKIIYQQLSPEHGGDEIQEDDE